ncbi:hypothetical protein V8E36_005419 [Tilletia maclaganii]
MEILPSLTSSPSELTVSPFSPSFIPSLLSAMRLLPALPVFLLSVLGLPLVLALPSRERCMDCYITVTEVPPPINCIGGDPSYTYTAPGGGGGWAGAERAVVPAPTDIGYPPIVDPPLCDYLNGKRRAE